MPRLRPVISAAAVALLVAACAGMSGQTAAPTTGPTAPAAPAPAAAAAVAMPADGLPAPVREILPNGLTLIIQDHRASDIVAVYLFIKVGLRYDRPDELGYSHFMEHMLFKGTDTWGPGYFDRAVEGVGGRSNAFTSFDYTTFQIVVPSEALDTAVGLLRDQAFRSVFDEKEIERERQVIFEEARIVQDTPKDAIVRQLYHLVFDDNPYGRPLLGTRATLNSANHERLLRYYKHFYTPENMELVVVGPVETKAVRALVDRTFGRVPSHGLLPTPAPVPAPLTAPVREMVERPEQQAQLAIGWQAPQSSDPAGDALDLVATILAGSESSRLTRKLRDDERLVRNITMNYAALVGGGIVSLRAAAEAKDLPLLERRIFEEIDRIKESGPTEEERQQALIKFDADHAFDTETSEGLAKAYGTAETTWTLDAEIHYVDRLRRITLEQIRDAARRYLSATHYARLAFVPKKSP